MECSILRVSNLMTANVNGETIMLTLEQGSYYGIGEIGSKIWDLIAQPTSIYNLVESVRQLFDSEQSLVYLIQLIKHQQCL